MKVLLAFMVFVMVLLIVAACFILPAVIKSSANNGGENKTDDPVVSVNITNNVENEAKVEASSKIEAAGAKDDNDQAEYVIILEEDESCAELDGSYILPFSSKRKLISQDIKYFNLEELILARNEIFARHGYIFSTSWIRMYFESKSWYKPDPYYDGSLNSIEHYNVDLIKEYEKVLKGESSNNNSCIDNSYILPYSHKKELTWNDIGYLSLDWLILARNEIFARHGYVFKTPWIRQYFQSKSWYVPNPSYKGHLNNIEDYNVHLIKEYEKVLKGQ